VASTTVDCPPKPKFVGAPVYVRAFNLLDPFDVPLTQAEVQSATVTIRDSEGNVVVDADPLTYAGDYWVYTWDTAGRAAGSYIAEVNILPVGATEPTPRYVTIVLSARPV
jgi:hypothetical protein